MVYFSQFCGMKHLKILIFPLSRSGYVNPSYISQTTSVGENVTIIMKTSRPNLRWRHNGGDVIKELNDQKIYTITTVTTNDSGIYECYEDGKRSDGKHAIFQLIVRG